MSTILDCEACAALRSERALLRAQLSAVTSERDDFKARLDTLPIPGVVLAAEDYERITRERDEARQALAAWQQTEWPNVSQDPKWGWFNDRLRGWMKTNDELKVELEKVKAESIRQREALVKEHAEDTATLKNRRDNHEYEVQRLTEERDENARGWEYQTKRAEAAEGEVKRCREALEACVEWLTYSPSLNGLSGLAVLENARAALALAPVKATAPSLEQAERDAARVKGKPEPSGADVDRDLCAHGWAGCDQCFAAWSARERELLAAVDVAKREARKEALTEAYRHAASIVRNTPHSCQSDEHCCALHQAHETAAQAIERALAAELKP